MIQKPITTMFKAIAEALLFCIVILIFPVVSGAISAILKLDINKTLLLQSAFMAMSLLVPAGLLIARKITLSDIGLVSCSKGGASKVLYYLPALLIFLPTALQGFCFQSIEYMLGSFLLYLFVGISEEIYFRGLIQHILQKTFSVRMTILLSTMIFGLGHSASAFSGAKLFEVVLTIINALIFGWMAAGLVVLGKSILPLIAIHFFFNFESKIIVMGGSLLPAAEFARGAIMFLYAIYLAMVISKSSADLYLARK